ncbi:MAG: hypothetical protein WCO09_04440 [bacterium]
MIFNTKAIKVLDAIKKDSQNTSTIAHKIKLPRTTVEYTLRTLESQNMVTSKKIGKATVWSTKNKSLDSHVSVIHGIPKIISAFESAVNKRKLEVIVIESDETVKIFEKKQYHELFRDLNKKFQQKNALVYILFHEETIRRMYKMKKAGKIQPQTILQLMNRAMSSHILPDHLFNLNMHIAAIGENVFFTDFANESCTQIRNKELATFFKHLFEFVSRTESKMNIKKILGDMLKV